MNENSMIVCLAFLGVLFYVGDNYVNSNKEIEFSKAGLEQYVNKDGEITWVKECKENKVLKDENAKN